MWSKARDVRMLRLISGKFLLTLFLNIAFGAAIARDLRKTAEQPGPSLNAVCPVEG
jgi:hypothetical protein